MCNKVLSVELLVYFFIRDMKPLGKVTIRWNRDFAYAIGLITTDGSLSKDQRHINFTSKDLQLIELFKQCLYLNNSIGRKNSGSTHEKKYFQIQFGDVLFYKFLLSIGLMPQKTKKTAELKIPFRYFFDFLRGHFDGDGSIYSYFDRRWKRSFMMYTVFCSASLQHITWLRKEIATRLPIQGHIDITHGSTGTALYQLKYAKKESIQLLHRLYSKRDDPSKFFQRKFQKVSRVLAQVEELADSSA